MATTVTEDPADAIRISELRTATRAKAWGLLVVFTMLTTGVVPNVAAQGPQREHSVRIPDTDIVLDEGWSLVLTAGRRCAYAIPAAWPVSGDGARAVRPDGAVSVSVAEVDVTNWSSYRRAVQTAMQPVIVHEDTSQRFWVERVGAQRAWHHISVTDGARVCSADIQSASSEREPNVMQRIASSVRVAHDGDQRWIKP